MNIGKRERERERERESGYLKGGLGLNSEKREQKFSIGKGEREIECMVRERGREIKRKICIIKINDR